MTKKTALAIIERAHRGAVEQQFAHVLWLVRALHLSLDLSVFLRGSATVYALRGQHRATLSLGGMALDGLPDYEASMCALVSSGVPVHVSAPCLRRLGLERPLIPGVRPAEAEQMARLCEQHDHIWYL